MQEIKLLTKRDIVILVALAVFVFIAGFLSWGMLLGNTSVGLLLPDWVLTVWGAFTILGFDVLLVITAFKSLHHGNIKLKIFLTTLLVALSASLVLSSWVVKGIAVAMH